MEKGAGCPGLHAPPAAGPPIWSSSVTPGAIDGKGNCGVPLAPSAPSCAVWDGHTRCADVRSSGAFSSDEARPESACRGRFSLETNRRIEDRTSSISTFETGSDIDKNHSQLASEPSVCQSASQPIGKIVTFSQVLPIPGPGPWIAWRLWPAHPWQGCSRLSGHRSGPRVQDVPQSTGPASPRAGRRR